MRVQQAIETKLKAAFPDARLDIVNESGMHSVPPGSESHFKVVLVSETFEGQGRVGRHRSVNALLAEELEGPVHALSLEALTPREWEARGGQSMKSPECLGGGKKG